MHTSIKSVDKGSHIHLMGICGTAMASLAALAKELGYKVTGSDENVYPPMSTFLEKRGIEIMKGFKAANLKEPRPDYVVVGNVMTKDHEESKALLASGIPYGSLPEALADLVIKERHSVVVCGTHGKTTTTAMASWVAEQAQLRPGFLVGGIAKNFETSFQNPEGPWFVIEGDEYDTAFFSKTPKFTFYKPKTAILSSIEFDHADIYSNLKEVKEAFRKLLGALPHDGLLIYNGQDNNVKDIIAQYEGDSVAYGFMGCEWTVQDISVEREGLRFNVYHNDKKEDELFVPMFGVYNALNALAVYIVAKTHGWEVDIPKAFAEFKGIKRRQELIGEPRGIQVIEDFAHHPTAVAGTLMSFQKRKGAGKLYAIFEPRSATSRRKYFQEHYAKAFAFADEAFISVPYKQDNLKDLALDVSQLTQDIQRTGTSATSFESVDDVIPVICEKAQPGDTILIMSNGAFQGIYSKLLSALEKA